jgi:hypothetical protein
LNDLGIDGGLGPQSLAKRLEALAAPGDQNEVKALARQPARKRRTDLRRRSGH